ncbi:alpha/beta hydrolase [Nakamurella sp. YIM 132084]|uniref:Alpha/beta hydrolase n=2 Tax=Nakamurella leprariae TaxID=2803911 RepID=A0A938YK50_9ACTN|nr:alpha/beta hydrolase [Nakamurella leprariae]
MLDVLGREGVTCLSPPGFGAHLPDGFGTRLDYRDWLIRELETFDEPVDLVGHDWGGGHVVAVAMARPDLLRSWVSDAIGIYHPEYVWHDLAQVWQTPGAGEQNVAERFGAPEPARAAVMEARGIDRAVAARLAAGQGEEMGRAVLRLYRSAAQPAMADAGRDLHLAAARPGLCVLAAEDDLAGPITARTRTAERAGARTAVLEGLGHWWMVQDPARAAGTLATFWDGVGRPPLGSGVRDA